MNAFLSILGFASNHDGITFENLYNHVQQHSIRFEEGSKITEHNTALINIFRTYFKDKNGNMPLDYNHGIYYLSADGYAYLMNFSLIEQNRIATENARLESIISEK